MDNKNVVKKGKNGLYSIPYKTRVPSFNEFIKSPDQFTKPHTAPNSDKLKRIPGDKDMGRFTKSEFVKESERVNESVMDMLTMLGNVDFSAIADFGKELWSWLVGVFTDATPAGGAAQGMTAGEVAQVMAAMFTGAGLTTWKVIRNILRANKQTANMLQDAMDLADKHPEVKAVLDKLRSKYKDDATFAKAVKMQIEKEGSPLRKAMEGALDAEDKKVEDDSAEKPEAQVQKPGAQVQAQKKETVA
jgi:hypothetical protein